MHDHSHVVQSLLFHSHHALALGLALGTWVMTRTKFWHRVSDSDGQACPINHWPWTIEIAWVDLGRPNPGSYKVKIPIVDKRGTFSRPKRSNRARPFNAWSMLSFSLQLMNLILRYKWVKVCSFRSHRAKSSPMFWARRLKMTGFKVSLCQF